MIKRITKKIIVVIIILNSINYSFSSNLDNISFSIDRTKSNAPTEIKEDATLLKKKNKDHSEKYFAYTGTKTPDTFDYTYRDADGVEHKMLIDKNALYNNIVWNKLYRASDKNEPLNYNAHFGIDVSKHNGDISWEKVKDAGIDFAFVRIIYRGYSSNGLLHEDERAIENLQNAKAAGLKVGAYVFSQSINEDEALEEAALAIKLLHDNNIVLDLPLVYDPETIKNDIARTDDISGDIFTNNAIAFCKEIKSQGITPAIYSNIIWEDYYFDMSRLKDYDIWYADYEDFPQTPYRYKYWQFSDRGRIDGINGYVDLNVMLNKYYD